ncbi:MAG: type II toxin-antitoxin system MqsA family antitoxin [Elusimicrobia bacterium]|nr:type II toxin-antitoxin system MqsA family antitoxin [Elusimicrobiota bacterium]
MKCVICRKGETREGHTVAALSRGSATVVFRDVPAQVCQNCGEAYLAEATTSQLLKLAESAAHAGVQVEGREYLAA